MKKVSSILVLALIGILVLALPALAVSPVSKVLVNIADGTPSTNSNLTLTWDAISVGVGNTAHYLVSKSTDGGRNFGAASDLTILSYTDNGVPDYTNVTYKIVVEEKDGSNVIVGSPSTAKLTNVYPPDTNAHANFTTNTTICGNCHKTHAATGAKLLKDATAQAVCESCHGFTGLASKYDVQDGETKTATGFAPSLGGPMNHTASGGDQWGNKSTTSAHSYDNTNVTAPGGYNATQALVCTSCHGAHETGNYRQIKTTINYINPSGTTSTATVNFTAAAKTENATSGETASYLSGSSSLCGACHMDFDTTDVAGAGTTLSGIFGMQKYRHAVGVSPSSYGGLTTTLPLEGLIGNNTDKVVCLTCHFAHGSVAVGTQTSTINNGAGNNNGSSTMLKRLDNMAVCEECHKK